MRRALLVGTVAGVLALAGCGNVSTGSESEDRTRIVQASDFDPVATLTEREDWAQGVNAHPLDPGESLAFVFPLLWSGVWNMRGVSYPLDLVALSDDGSEAGRLRMWPCGHRRASDSCEYAPPLPAYVFVEVRPLRS